MSPQMIDYTCVEVSTEALDAKRAPVMKARQVAPANDAAAASPDLESSNSTVDTCSSSLASESEHEDNQPPQAIASAGESSSLGAAEVPDEDESSVKAEYENKHGEMPADDDDSAEKQILRPVLKAQTSYGPDAAQHGGRRKPPIRRFVSFDSITIREYDQTLGDHPCCSYGPPLVLDWNYSDENQIDVEEYEVNRPERRTMRGMLMSWNHRKNLLQWQYGLSEEEIKRGTKETNRSKTRRSVTKYFLPVMKVEEVVSSVGRKTQRAFLKEKRDERSSKREFLALYA